MHHDALRELNRKRTIRQICFVTRDLDRTMKRWVEDLGIGPWSVFSLTNENMTAFTVAAEPVNEPFEFLAAFTQVGPLEFELVQPVRGPNIYTRFLEEKGEGFHHIKEKISDGDMQGVLAEYRRKGIAVTQSGLFGKSEHYYLNTGPRLDLILELGNCPEQRVAEGWVRTYPDDNGTP